MEQKMCYGCMREKIDAHVCEHCGYDEKQSNKIHQLPIGTVLKNQYLVGKVLGQGGFGITYIGWDQILEIPVAIKEYFPSGMIHRNIQNGLDVNFYNGNEESLFISHRDRFLKEARTLAKLSYIPDIVQVKNFFVENSTAYIVMEYVEGVTLKKYLELVGRPLTFLETMEIFSPVLRAMERIHDANLIHRDISPDNIMLPIYGGVKIIDFGTVKYLDGGSNSKSTESILKPGFAPIEQYNSRGKIGPWTDVYSLCATMFYLMTGKVPPDATARIDEESSALRFDAISGITPAIENVLEKAMEIRVANRISNVREFRECLSNAMSAEGPVQDKKDILRNCPRAGMSKQFSHCENVNKNELTESQSNKKQKKNIILALVGVIAALCIVSSLFNNDISNETMSAPIIGTDQHEVEETDNSETFEYEEPEETTLGAEYKTEFDGTEISYGFLDHTQFSEILTNGTYRCGSDFNPGDYYILSLFGNKASYNVSDSPDSFTYSARMSYRTRIENGQYIKIESGAILVHAEEVDELNYQKYGVYLVGKDLPSGVYKITAINDVYRSDIGSWSGNLGAYQISDGFPGSNIVKCTSIHQEQEYLTLVDGQYITIVNAKLVLQ